VGIIFLVGSLVGKKKRRQRSTEIEYLSELLQALRESTGLVFAAICSGGGAIFKPHQGAVCFEQMLDACPFGLRAIICIACGDDFLMGNWSIRRLGIDFDESVYRLCAELTAKAASSFAVVGGSAETWKYSRWMGENVQRCLSQFVSCGIHAVSGS
jgi:hypothetical protein